jgi:hypothetical protein
MLAIVSQYGERRTTDPGTDTEITEAEELEFGPLMGLDPQNHRV